MNTNQAKLPASLTQLRSLALPAGVVLLVVAIILSVILRREGETMLDRFMQGYMVAYAFWGGISIGSIALIMIHHMTAGAWSFITQRIYEAASRTLYWVVIPGFLLIALGPWAGLHTMYEGWAGEEISHIVATKTAFLNVPAWTLRAILYFVIFAGMAFFLNRWSQQLDETRNPLITLKFRRLSPPGVIVWCLTMTFAACDWFMSLEPEWFSTIYGPLFWVSQGVTIFAFTILILEKLAQEKPLSTHVTAEHYYLLGTLMLAFMILWAYMSFSQYLIIWAGNLTEEIPYYLVRGTGGWQLIAAGLIVLHFFIPLFVLLQRRLVKDHINRLKVMCYWMLGVRVLDLFWVVFPAFHYDAPGVYATDILMTVLLVLGFGGIWLWVFLRELPRYGYLPLQDPRLYEAIHTLPAEQEAMEHA